MYIMRQIIKPASADAGLASTAGNHNLPRVGNNTPADRSVATQWTWNANDKEDWRQYEKELKRKIPTNVPDFHTSGIT